MHSYIYIVYICVYIYTHTYTVFKHIYVYVKGYKVCENTYLSLLIDYTHAHLYHLILLR